MKLPDKKLLLKYLPTALMLLLMLGGAGYILTSGAPKVDEILAFIHAHETLAVLILLGLFALKGVSAILLYSVLTTATGLLFDFVPALFINLAGTAICVTIPYLAGRVAKREDVLAKLRANKKLRKYETDGKMGLFPLCFVLRTVGVQSEVLGLLFGNLGMPYLPFLAASLLGMFSTLLSYTVLGTTVSRLSPISLIFFALDTAILVVTVLLYRKKIKEKEKARRDGEPPETVEKGEDVRENAGADVGERADGLPSEAEKESRDMPDDQEETEKRTEKTQFPKEMDEN